jgi:predicted amidohydrolase
MKTLKIAIVQTSASRDMGRNLQDLSRRTADIRHIDLIALPEVFAVRGSADDYRHAAESLRGRVVNEMAGLARKKKAWVLAGSIIEKCGKRTFNTSVLLDRRGRIVGIYRKIHLFEARLEGGKHIRESDAYEAGRTPTVVDIEGWRAGLSICYDLRFPELFRIYSDRKAHLLFVPSNFTQRTGKDHWEVLLRARAIENQCFVVAPNQCGMNEAIGVSSYGHSMAVGPWGEVLCKAGTHQRIFIVELDPRLLTNTRRRIPALRHRILC